MSTIRSHSNPELYGLKLPKGLHASRPYYRFMRMLCKVFAPMFGNIRVYNRHYEPASGGALYICNHQSFLDPMLMGMSLRRPMNFMARDTLFEVPLLKLIMGSLNTFPVRRGTADTRAIKEAMKRLKEGRQVVVFAEGTRTYDGSIRKFLPGVGLLAKRSADWVVPTVIDGAYEAWPRKQKFPSQGNIVVQYGKPIPKSEFRKADTTEFLQRVRRELIQMQTDIRKRLNRPQIVYNDLD